MVIFWYANLRHYYFLSLKLHYFDLKFIGKSSIIRKCMFVVIIREKLIYFIELFHILKQLWKQRSRQINELFVTRNKIDETLNEILDEVHIQIKFKGEKEMLLKRIRKLSNNQEFSFRENKLLRRIVSAQLVSGKIDFNYIEYFFPGKSQEVIRKETGKVLASL